MLLHEAHELTVQTRITSKVTVLINDVGIAHKKKKKKNSVCFACNICPLHQNILYETPVYLTAREMSTAIIHYHIMHQFF